MLILTENPEAQRKIVKTLAWALTQQSKKASESLYQKIISLDRRSETVRIYSAYKEGNSVEFAIGFYKDINSSNPFMVGGLVYDQVSQTWGTHT